MDLYYTYVPSPDRFTGPWTERNSNIPLPNGGTSSRPLQADPPNDLYLAIPDTRPLPDYWKPGPVVLSFTGTLLSDDGRIVEDRRINDVKDTIDEVRATKYQELDHYNIRMASSPFQHDAGPLQFWVPTSEAQMSRMLYCAYLAARIVNTDGEAVEAGIATGGGTNPEVGAWWTEKKRIHEAPNETNWQRDIPVYLYTRDDPPQRVEPTDSNRNQWADLLESEGTFVFQYRKARQRVVDDIELHYGNADQASLEAIDVTAASYNWPPFYPGNLELDSSGFTTISTLLGQ